MKQVVSSSVLEESSQRPHLTIWTTSDGSPRKALHTAHASGFTRPPSPWGTVSKKLIRQVPSVVVQVEGECGEAAEVREALDQAIKRGVFRASQRRRFWFGREPSTEQTACRQSLRTVLEGRVRHRTRIVGRAYVVVTTLLTFALVFMGDNLDIALLQGRGFVLAAVAPPILALLAVRFEHRLRGSTRVLVAWRWLTNAIFPAVQIAEKTPGRRVVGAAVGLLTIGVPPVIGWCGKDVARR